MDKKQEKENAEGGETKGKTYRNNKRTRDNGDNGRRKRKGAKQKGKHFEKANEHEILAPIEGESGRCRNNT